MNLRHIQASSYVFRSYCSGDFYEESRHMIARFTAKYSVAGCGTRCCGKKGFAVCHFEVYYIKMYQRTINAKGGKSSPKPIVSKTNIQFFFYQIPNKILLFNILKN